MRSQLNGFNIINKISSQIINQNQILNGNINNGTVNFKSASFKTIECYPNNSKIDLFSNLDLTNNNINNVKDLYVTNLSGKGTAVISSKDSLVIQDNIIMLNKPDTTQGINVDSGIILSYSDSSYPGLIYKRVAQTNILNGRINRFVLGNVDVTSNIDGNGNPYLGNANITGLATLHVGILEGNLMSNLNISSETPITNINGNLYINKRNNRDFYYRNSFVCNLWMGNITEPIHNLNRTLAANLEVMGKFVSISISGNTFVGINDIPNNQRLYIMNNTDLDNIPSVYRPLQNTSILTYLYFKGLGTFQYTLTEYRTSRNIITIYTSRDNYNWLYDANANKNNNFCFSGFTLNWLL